MVEEKEEVARQAAGPNGSLCAAYYSSTLINSTIG
jgi:hypothetical protein